MADSVTLDEKSWESLSYKNIPANKNIFSNNQLVIKVDSSAGPLIFPFEGPKDIKSLKVVGNIKGSLSLGNKVQGSTEADDFIFRIGLVYQGDNTLNFFQQAIAPKWIKKLYSLADQDQGVSNIHFYNLVSQKSLLGQKRSHPMSDLLIENFHTLKPVGPNFTLNVNQLPKGKVLALWLSLDGDQTQSKFEVTLKEITLNE